MARLAAIPAEDLAQGIATLSRNGNVEILAPSGLLRGRIGHAVRPSASVDAALAEMLAGTGLTYQHVEAGTFIVVAAPAAKLAQPPAAPAPAIAEILVVGQQSLDADIRRRADDVQPYEIVEQDAIDRAQPDNSEDYTRTNLTMNSQALSTAQSPLASQGSLRSEIDLRGLGPDQTLVLIDGRRLPSVPMQGEFLQPDIRGLPTDAIQRIEVLGSSAGSIFGPGAAGGAINFVLDRDTDQNAITVRRGISERGDAANWSIDGRLGYASPGGNTHLVALIGYSRDDGLLLGDRSFADEARLLRVSHAIDSITLPKSDSINILALTGTLVLAPAYGGESLGVRTTSLPLDAPAAIAGGAALLLANAGHLDLGLSPDGSGSDQSLLTSARTLSVLLSGRQRIGDHLQVFVDAMRLQDTGAAHIPALSANAILLPGQAGNPFANLIAVTFPVPGLSGLAVTRTRTDRILGGVIAQLGHGWSASLDWAEARATVRTRITSSSTTAGSLRLFDGGASLLEQLAGISDNSLQTSYGLDRMSDGNIRIAGPLFSLPGGPLSLTISGETLREHNPGADDRSFVADALLFDSRELAQRRRTDSVFAELRAPLIPPHGRIGPLRLLEIQLAARRDRYAIEVPTDTTNTLTTAVFGTHVSNRAAISSTTAGIRASPLKGIVVRASYATSYTPPSPEEIAPEVVNFPTFALVDLKRGGAQPITADEIAYTVGGNPALRPQPTHTWSFGIVLAPTLGAATRLRISVDFSAFRTNRAISPTLPAGPQAILDQEEAFPERVVRAPLSPADAALGYTGGKILSIDGSYFGDGARLAKTVDVSADAVRKLATGDLHLAAQATWEPVDRQRITPDADYHSLVGHTDGPLKWRVVGSVEWVARHWSTGFSVQYYAPSKVTKGEAGSDAFNAEAILLQGQDALPSQTYLDWTAAITTRLGSGDRGPSLEYRLSVKDLLDKRPPLAAMPLILTSDSPGYNTYGDPRGRRFELQASLRF